MAEDVMTHKDNFITQNSKATHKFRMCRKSLEKPEYPANALPDPYETELT